MSNPEIYPERESKTLEFKSTVTTRTFDSLIKTAIAFANGVGGKIIVGVDDKTRKIIGISDKVRDRIYDDFPNSLYDSTKPHLIAQIYEQCFDDKTILIVEIPPSLKKPCFLRSKGTKSGIYLRIGSCTRIASEDYIAELIRENQRISFDEEEIHEPWTILSKDLLKTHYKKLNTASLLEDKIIARAAVNRESFHPTIAGLLLFYDEPDHYIPEAHVICTRFGGTKGRNIIQTEEVKGPISKQIEVSYNLVSYWLKRHFRLEGVKMKSDQLVPEEALREAITNAVIHRKYSIPGATKIAVYEDRVEIFSPGNFPGHVDVNNLGDGITHLRNPTLGRMAHKMRIIEKLGSGIKLIFESCDAANLVRPTFSEDGDYVKVIFKFEAVKHATKTREENLIELFRFQETVTINEMVEHLGCSKNTVFKVLNNLIKNKKVERIGRGPNTRYVLKNSFYKFDE